jgi:triosephosphate isomerase (TIM)
MKKLIVANWKLNPATLAAAERLAKAVEPAARRSRAEVVFCPPAPYIATLKARFPKLVFGAQNTSYFDEGPHTGSFGPSVLKSVGAEYVIAGHSERRSAFGDTDADIAKKVKAISAAGLTTILCVGEQLPVRKKGMAAAQKFVAQQLKASLKNIPRGAKVIVAYEPVWAISTSGSGKKETAEDAAAMIRFIKKLRPGRVLYGGSVNSKDANDFLDYREIDGALVGGASLRPDDFSAILRNA